MSNQTKGFMMGVVVGLVAYHIYISSQKGGM